MERKLIQVWLTGKEYEMVEELVERLGYPKVPPLFREMLREKHLKIFPPYRSGAATGSAVAQGSELTPEQICEKQGGTVVRTPSGAMVCRIPLVQGVSGGAMKSVPLSMMGEGEYK